MGSWFPRKQAVPIGTLKGDLPEAVIAEDIDHASVAQSSIEKLDSLSSDMLTQGALWRDLLALTGTARTFYGSQTVSSAWQELWGRHHPHNFNIIPESSHIMRVGPDNSWVQARFTFETNGNPGVLGSGFIGLVPDLPSGNWRIWLLSTLLEQIKGHPNCDLFESESKAGSARPRTHCLEASKSSRFDCVIVGAGMAGLSVAGRLEALGVSYVILEKNPQIGDNWMNRYDSATRK